MKKLAYIILSIGIIFITIGIVLQLIKNDCDNKTIQEYFESGLCRYVGNN